MVEHYLHTVGVGGSNPSPPIFYFGYLHLDAVDAEAAYPFLALSQNYSHNPAFVQGPYRVKVMLYPRNGRRYFG